MTEKHQVAGDAGDTNIPQPRVGRSVRRFCHEVDISQAFFYELRAKGLIDTVKVFGKSIVLTDPREFLKSFRTGCSSRPVA
ncbi:MAG: hypothetical protein HQL37_03585 [Alphaproteobacteria bacterium]|nr:hypothetical protein [Alphaproteobacteria bacterium]